MRTQKLTGGHDFVRRVEGFCRKLVEFWVLI